MSKVLNLSLSNEKNKKLIYKNLILNNFSLSKNFIYCLCDIQQFMLNLLKMTKN